MFDEVYCVSDKKVTVLPDQIIDLVKSLEIPLPPGYLEYMTTLGKGSYCDKIIVYEPELISKEYQEARKTWDDNYFWEAGKEVLTKEQVLNSILFAISEDGDDIIFQPDIPDKLFVLPRQDNTIYWIEGGFYNPLNWYGIGHIPQYTPQPLKYFIPYVNREFFHFETSFATNEFSDIVNLFASHWKESVIHQYPLESNCVRFFLQTIGAKIQLLQTGNQKFRIYIDYDKDYREEVALFSNSLRKPGFYYSGEPPGSYGI